MGQIPSVHWCCGGITTLTGLPPSVLLAFSHLEQTNLPSDERGGDPKLSMILPLRATPPSLLHYKRERKHVPGWHLGKSCSHY